MPRRSGFTLIELLVVIAIIGVLSTLAIIALGSARQKSRDAKRIADLSQISKALELYYADNASYPTVITPGLSLQSPNGATTYMASIPSNPTPWAEGSCPNSNYVYTYHGSSYTLLTCLAGSSGGLSAGGIAVSGSAPVSIGAVSGLVGYWKFEEGSGTTAYDASGTGNTATVTTGVSAHPDGPLWSSAGVNGIGSFLNFNGTDDFFSIPDNATVRLTTGATIAMWIKQPTSGPSSLLTFGRYSGGSNRSYLVEVYSNGGSSYWYWSVSGNGSAVSSYRSVSSFAPDSNWHHVAVTYDGTSLVLYRDGAVIPSALYGVTPIPASIFAGTATLQSQYGVGAFSKGGMDNVRLYNRALTAAEVLELYNNKQ